MEATTTTPREQSDTDRDDFSASPTRGTIAYIAHYFPALSQTFVYREIRALEALGWDIRYFSIRRPDDRASEDAGDMAERTFYLLPYRKSLLIARLARLFLRRPWRFLRTLALVTLARGESWKARLHGLTHFAGGMYLVPELQRAGVRHFHAHFGKNPATLALVAAEYLGIPFSMTIHATDLFVSGLLLARKLEHCKFVASISEYNRELLLELSADPDIARKIHVLHCGIDLERFPERAETPCNETPLIVSVGRLVEKKGFPYLLEAARILKTRGVAFEVRIIGGGPDREELERKRRELGVEDRVRLEGAMAQERLLPVLARADVFVLPCVRAHDGDQDGIPVSLMEAMAYGIPCVSTTVSGVPELIEHGTEGLLAPERDAAALADALERLVLDRDLRLSAGKAARRKVEGEFSLRALAEGLDRLYRAEA